MRETGFRAMRMDGKGMIHGTSLIQRKDWMAGIWVHRVFLLDGDACNQTPDSSSFVEVKFNTVGQSTGLLDKNGTNIYEGDALQADDGDGWVTGVGVVEFASGRFRVRTLEDGLEDDINTDMEAVIGNVYEHPELLEVPS